jgi:hypothetical protein
MRKSWIREPSARAAQSGNVMIFVLVGLVGMIAVTSLGIDVGLTYNARTQAQAAADAAALAAAGSMINGNAVTLAAGTGAATAVASQNAAYPNASLTLAPADVTYGFWDLDTRTFDTSVDLTDPDQVTGVQTVIRLDGALNESVPAQMARVLGVQSFDVDAAAIGYLGFAGSVFPGSVDLPIAIPCCVLNGPACDQDYCGTGAPLPNPCPLVQPQPRGDNTVSCIQFQNTAEQTGCWTLFDGVSPSINTSDLIDIVHDGNPDPIVADDPIFLDNGDKTPVVSLIADLFYGTGEFAGNPEGVDTDGDGLVDSWVVGLPVVECQSTDHCAKGTPVDVVGFVCFEIREVTVVPDKIIRGSFLCPELHPQKFAQCASGLGLKGTGGENFGIRADLPVLVR